ncbi:exonuclease domain-containing protein [Terasakiella sp. A23]|uniref:exonuclease domain-containing protein n=1 Tax=Terasakiella sp. FCG-A23 TaxID=3080561 RepID=UPI0029532027|nr:exonuclease domain-containing protein [Terasakiella sp. A23]MDV7339233.1 exonuclease domain-containing protein [Terasakiella sp. A23]
MWKRLFGPDLRREWYLIRMPDGPMKEYYRKPIPWPETDYRELEYLCIDLELTGLNPEKDEILSIGFAPIVKENVVLSESAHYLVKPSSDLPEDSVIVHGLTDDRLAEAEPLEEILPHVLLALSGRVLLAHHAPIEIGFLNAACERIYGYPLLTRAVDTLELEKRNRQQRNQPLDGGVLRLAKAREVYNLPRYRAHNALVDAVASGELFLAQAAHKASKGEQITLRELMFRNK